MTGCFVVEDFVALVLESVKHWCFFGNDAAHVIPAPLKYWFQRKGWWTTNYVEAGGFAKTQLATQDPDIQFHFTPLYRSYRGKAFEFGHGC